MNVRELFPNVKEGRYHAEGLPDYDSMLLKVCDEVVVSEAVGDWQGDYLYVLRKGDQYAYKKIGYGSCSGCDALQAVETYEDLQKLFDEVTPTEWESKAEVIEFLKKHDWEGDYFYRGDGPQVQKFVKAALTALGADQ